MIAPKYEDDKNCLALCYIPNVHQSTAFPWVGLRSNSGARYSGVPQIVVAPLLLPLIPRFDNPKSHNLMKPSLSIKTFSGLRLELKVATD